MNEWMNEVKYTIVTQKHEQGGKLLAIWSDLKVRLGITQVEYSICTRIKMWSLANGWILYGKIRHMVNVYNNLFLDGQINS